MPKTTKRIWRWGGRVHALSVFVLLIGSFFVGDPYGWFILGLGAIGVLIFPVPD